MCYLWTCGHSECSQQAPTWCLCAASGIMNAYFARYGTWAAASSGNWSRAGSPTAAGAEPWRIWGSPLTGWPAAWRLCAPRWKTCCASSGCMNWLSCQAGHPLLDEFCRLAFPLRVPVAACVATQACSALPAASAGPGSSAGRRRVTQRAQLKVARPGQGERLALAQDGSHR